MSEQDISLAGDFHSFLAERGADTYALAWIAKDSDATRWATAGPPTVGKTGIARPGADLTRVMLHEVTHGKQETLRRWLQLDQQLAIIGTDEGGLREYTPGELAAQLMQDPATDGGQLTRQLAGWLYRRYAEAPQGLELGWVAAAAAWSCHLREVASTPPPSVLAQSLASAGEQDEATEDLILGTAMTMARLFDRLSHIHRPRAEFVEDWHLVEPLAADVPALGELADWLLDQIALRDASAQQLRAVLEPDITDYLHDRRANEQQGSAAPALDEARTRQLVQAHGTVLAYTAAAHSGREQQAQHLLNAFPVPARDLNVSSPARAWRHSSATAQHAVEAVEDRRAALAAEDGSDYFADPERLHAETAYLAARAAQLNLEHDALGRFAVPVPMPGGLPHDLADIAAGLAQRRLSEAFGTPERARQVLDGRITYLQQQPVQTQRQDDISTEVALLETVLRTLEAHLANPVHLSLDEGAIARRVQQAMSARTPEPSWRPPPAHERQRRIEAQSHAFRPESGTPGLRR